jgi:hypothetical protein
MARWLTLLMMAGLAGCSPSHQHGAPERTMISGLPSCLKKAHWTRASRTGAIVFSSDPFHGRMGFNALDRPIEKPFRPERIGFEVILRSSASDFFAAPLAVINKAFEDAGSPKLPRDKVAEAMQLEEAVHLDKYGGGWIRGKVIGWVSSEYDLCGSAGDGRWLIVERFQPAVALKVR